MDSAQKPPDQTASDPALDAAPPEPSTAPPAHPASRTRTASAWTSLIAGAVVLVLLLIFILENTQRVKVNFLGANGHLALGVALLLAAAAGALLVGIVGVARITQVKRRASRARRAQFAA
jgi:uncharacterized integral membrane protein